MEGEENPGDCRDAVAGIASFFHSLSSAFFLSPLPEKIKYELMTYMFKRDVQKRLQ